MRETIKMRFRREFAGYNAEHQCKDCAYCICVYCGKRHVYKCKKMGISGSAATDIRKKDIACTLFEERSEE